MISNCQQLLAQQAPKVIICVFYNMINIFADFKKTDPSSVPAGRKLHILPKKLTPQNEKLPTNKNIFLLQYRSKGLQNHTRVKRVYYTHITRSLHAASTQRPRSVHPASTQRPRSVHAVPT